MPEQDGVVKLFEALQHPGADALRKEIRNIAVNQIKSATPGAAAGLTPFAKSRPFRNIFFPNYSSLPFQEKFAALADNQFWTNYSVACLCGAIYNLTTSLRKQMLYDKIRDVMNRSFEKLKPDIKEFYRVMLEYYSEDNPVKAALDKISDRKAARNSYRGFLLDNTWITARNAQWTTGDWPDRDWEMYHHYLKLKLLGADDWDIDSLIDELLAKGLQLSNEVRRETWRHWSGWWYGAPIDWTDFSEASGPITEVVCYVYFGAVFPSYVREGNSFDFTAISMPGNPYRELPRSCCFAKGTQVVMADGTLRNIETVSAGEKVRTPAGQASVLLVSMPLRARRTLYTINQHKFYFAETHPFVPFDAGPQRPGYACANPMRLIEDAPFFSLFGVTSLLNEEGASLRRYGAGGDRAEKVKSLSVSSAETTEDELLYDLILDFEENGSSEYYAGDEDAQYLVASEMPPPYTVPDISLAFMKIYKSCHAEILDCLKDVETANFAKVLYEALACMWTGMFPLQNRMQAEEPREDDQADHKEEEVFLILESCLSDFSSIQKGGTAESAAESNIRAGVLFNALWSEIGIPLAGELGITATPTGGHSESGGVELNPYQIELKKPFPDAAPQLQITLESGEAKESKTLKTCMPQDHTHGMFLVTERGLRFAAIPMEEDVFTSPCSISFTLLPADTVPGKGWKAFMFLPASLSGGYTQAAHLYDENGDEVGCIQFHS
ncbi:MAG: hypothetical protein K2N78_11985, partial [Oscillospiraceae bacterium]|nr:hypothetical protein [Oscillospiraceae bacterium]